MPGPLTKPPEQHGAGTAVTQPGAEAAVAKAAKKWGIPKDVLWGVYGVETSFGANIATSSAGAVGAFQFLPSTAAGYGYPLTNQPNAAQFARQADGAAHYLHDLLGEHGGDMNAALHAYSGGGYGLSQVNAMATGKQAHAFDSPTRPGSVAGTISDAATAIPDFLGKLTDQRTWLRVIEVLVGVALLLMGLKSFTGGAIDPAGAAAGAARRVVPV